MSFYSKLSERLDLKEKDELPRGYQILGKILIVKLKPKLLRHRKEIGKAILEMFPYIRTVCLAKDITGAERKPKIEVIAGCKNTLTLNRENGCQFLVDVSKVMWS